MLKHRSKFALQIVVKPLQTAEWALVTGYRNTVMSFLSSGTITDPGGGSYITFQQHIPKSLANVTVSLQLSFLSQKFGQLKIC